MFRASRTTGQTRTGVALAALMLLGAVALPAAAADGDGEDPVLEELRALRQRVEELEAWKKARQSEDSKQDGDLSRAVEEYLATRQVEGPSGGIVVAPKTKRIELGGMVRVRGEMQRRSPTPPDVEGRHTNEFVLGRVRLHARAEILDDLGAYIELQDARVWGEEDSTAADGDGVDLSQGYIDWKRLFDTDTDARLGRQSVALADERLVGPLEWSNSGRRFDGLTVKHHRDGNTFTGFAYRLADGFVDGDTSDDDTDFLGLWMTFPEAIGSSTFELFHLWLNDTSTTFGETRPDGRVGDGHTKFGTHGVRFHGSDDDSGFDWDAQAAVQSGEISGDDLSAFAARGQVGYRFADVSGKPRFLFEYNYATGDEDLDDGDVDQFQVLFPTNHGYYGIHDLQAWSNMRAWAAHGFYSLSDSVTLKASYWKFDLDEENGGWVVASGKQLRPGADAGTSLGSEVDLIVTWQQNERVQWQFGWAHFWEGRFARHTTPDGGNDTASDFFYIQTLMTF